jgi:hypothetical protein
MVLFANYKTFIVKDEDKKNKVQGGKRVMYAAHHPCWDAKNRNGLPEELPFEYSAIAHCLELSKTNNANLAMNQQKKEEKPPEIQNDTSREQQPVTDIPFDDYTGIPDSLADLMKANNVSVLDIQKVVAYRGYYPVDMPIGSYPEDFINGVLVSAWPQVFAMIQASKEDKPY